MSKFEVLSVAQDGYVSDYLTAAQKHYQYASIYYTKQGKRILDATVHELRISLDVKCNVLVRSFENDKLTNTIAFKRIDIDGLISYLQEVKTFISEEEMVAKLLGRPLY